MARVVVFFSLSLICRFFFFVFFFFQAEDGIRDWSVTGVQTCALPIFGDVAASKPAAVGASPIYELDSAKRTLSAGPILIAVVIIAACVGGLLYFTNPAPVVSGGITEIVPVEQVTKDRVLVTIEAKVHNLSQQEIVVRGVDAKLTTTQGGAH